MNILLSVAITTGILSGIWGWVTVSLGLLNWANFLDYTAYLTCPQSGLGELWVSAYTPLSGVMWASMIINGNMPALHIGIIGYVMTGVVAFLMCIRAEQWLLSFVPGTFIGAYAAFAGQGNWQLVVPSSAPSLVFDYVTKSGGL